MPDKLAWGRSDCKLWGLKWLAARLTDRSNGVDRGRGSCSRLCLSTIIWIVEFAGVHAAARVEHVPRNHASVVIKV